MNHSDSESRDSDEGIRYKTESIRYKSDKNLSPSRSRSRSPKDDSRNSPDFFGPHLPPRLHKVKESSSVEPEKKCFGPLMPRDFSRKEEASTSQFLPNTTETVSIGPQLPPHLKKNEDDTFGPHLPPHLKNEDIGPKLPPDLDKSVSSCIGPQIPPHLRQKLQENSTQEESDDEIYGPLPAGTLPNSKSQIALEERALLLKMDQLEPSKDKPKLREEWMLELPEAKAKTFGLGARQFRSKPGPDMSDRSSWTDTPDKKKKKVEEPINLKKEAELKEMKKRDREQEKMAKKVKRKNEESLLEMHQNKMKEKKKDEGPSERRPFSREVDLQVNRFDEAQKKAVLKKAQLLDDRFSSGQSKFL